MSTPRTRRAITIAVVLFICGFVAAGAAEQTRVVFVEGVVRLHNDDGSFSRARVGDVVTTGMSVSTGFDASAELAVGASRVTVDPISFVEFAELSQSDEAADTTLDLSFGRVRSRVRSADQRRTDFEVRSPVSTATVKGTDFVYDGSLLTVFEGDVSLQNSIGQSHSVRAGQRSRAYGYETIQSVEAYFAEVSELE